MLYCATRNLLVCFASAMVYTSFSPYAERKDDYLAKACQISLFFALVSSIVLRLDGSNADSDALGVLLVVAMFAPVVFAILLAFDLRKNSVLVKLKCAALALSQMR